MSSMESIRYDFDTEDELKERLEKAKTDFDRLVNDGYKSVRIVVSRHPYSEGVWVEYGNDLSGLSAYDTVYKTNQ
jgi:hypothetical protein